VLVVLWVEKVSLEHLGPWGWVVVALVVWLLLRKRVAGAALWARQQLPQAKEAVMNWRPTPQQARLLAVAGLFLALVPLRERVTTDFVLEPSARAELRAQVDGIVRAVPVREDQLVAAGTLLAVLHNPDLETRAEVVGHELRLAEQQLRAAQSHDEDAVAQAQGRERQRLRAEHEMLQVRRSLLEIRAPLDGTLVTPQIDQRVGEYLRAGDPFCVVADRRVMRARVLVPDRDLEDITVGAPASLQVNAYPLSSFEGTVRQILPAAALDHPVGRSASERRGQALYNYFAVTLELDNPSGRLIEGLTGTARLYGTRRPLALQALRSAWRWTRSRIWV
jgi:multidrug efflux pump subunit AcrA (membrane-fusion protein)